ncbi:MAG TPA: translocation/assembly module TamB domain-containing protein, partial [Saprospiraceae bacterium]|nr:translocation/assembly module TamB domain-containing protein [Saprospiraceae bacterium]
LFMENGMLPADKTKRISLGSIDLTMNMTLTEDAIVELIFDENSGEVLRGSGTGNIALHMTPTGNFTMYGKFTISQGDYLFTNFAIIKKPFELLPGGTIQWTGNPYDANIDIQAQYKGLSASVYTLIQEYLLNETADVINEARSRTEIDLTMTLTGSLLHPDISFDIAFPLLTGKLKAYTDSKINTLKANENAMLEQVMGLLVTRTFLPSTLGTAQINSTIDATFTDLISATLSSYLGGLLGDIIPQGKVLSGIDFQLAVDYSITGQNPEDTKESGVEIDLPLQFFNDRLEVNVGGNYVKGAAFVEASEYYAGDVSFGYYITPDRRLKIRAYNQNTLTVEGRKNKVGLGVAYKREYNNVGEIFGKKK